MGIRRLSQFNQWLALCMENHGLGSTPHLLDPLKPEDLQPGRGRNASKVRLGGVQQQGAILLLLAVAICQGQGACQGGAFSPKQCDCMRHCLGVVWCNTEEQEGTKYPTLFPEIKCGFFTSGLTPRMTMKIQLRVHESAKSVMRTV
jgi:hypothetical protein